MTKATLLHHVLRKKADLRDARKREGQKGFTLIELSIVLVIIGLIISGVLTGQDLILAAKIRSTVSQYQSFDTAAKAFENKYGYLPGDIPSSTAEAFGFTYVIGGNATQGDGDGYIGSTVSLASAEGVMFWTDLYQANLIPNALTDLTAGAAWTVSDAVAASLPTLFPLAKIGGGNYFWVATYTDGFNYYGIGPITSDTVSSSTAGPTMAAGGLSPVQAYDIDVKVDDGVPTTGIVQSINTSVGGVATLVQGGSTLSCINHLNLQAYSEGQAQSKVPSCQIKLRFN